MNFKFRVVEKYINLLFVFLIPVQLAIHFWPTQSFLYGIRIDYLSPTIYLTDILFLLLFLRWGIASSKKIGNDIRKHCKQIIIFIIFVGVNILFSINSATSLVRWLVLIEMFLVYYYIHSRKDIFSTQNLGMTLFTSLSTFSLIGIVQFINRGTIGSLLYLFGERTFTVFTPGIAIVNLYGRLFLRAYSTFPHPNAFAGFLCAGLIYIFLVKPKINKYIFFLGVLLMVSSVALTFSLSALVGLGIFALVYLTFKYNNKFIKRGVVFILPVIVLSFYLALVSDIGLAKILNLSQSTTDRLRLALVARDIIVSHPIVGTGLNTFLISISKTISIGDFASLLQPVHNITLLIVSELGFLWLFLISIALNKFWKRLYERKIYWFIFVLIFVLTTGLFDHYWLTIHQNIMLIAVLAGHSSYFDMG